MRPFLLAALLLAPVLSAHARTLEVGPDKEYKQPSAAINAAKDGDRVLIQPGEYFDCAFVRANRLTIEGVGGASKVSITDKACGGKGLLVIGSGDVTIRGITLARARVPDGNGAGIRHEGGNLTIEDSAFVNNQDGILATSEQQPTIIIRRSTFDRNGNCKNSGGCAHGIYIGGGALLRVEASTFTNTKEGHHIKSRALRTEIVGCTVQDGAEGTASYLIEAPIGGSLVVRDSTLQKGPAAENRSAAIVIGAEGVSQPTRELLFENNNFRNDGSWETIFVRNLTATDAVLRNNRFEGRVKPLDGDGTVTPR
jgi:hypothetical protein